MDNSMKDFDSVWAQIEPIIINNIKQSFPDKKELVENLPGMLELAKRVRLTEDRAARKLGLDFLYEAERDVKSCKVLYSKKLYPHATYHFQQAVEKATKGYMLGLGFYEIRELRELMSHFTPQLFLKAVLEKTGIKLWSEKLSDKNLAILITRAENEISDEDKRLVTARMSYDNVDKLLSQIDVYQNIVKQMYQSLVREVSKILKTKFPPPLLLQTLSPMATMFILAVISFPHEAYTRYPEGRMTPSDYATSLGVVRAVPRMMKYLEPEIEKLKAILS